MAFRVFIGDTRQFIILILVHFPQMAQHNHLLKRLQHTLDSFVYRTSLPDDETIRESIQSFAISCNNPRTFSRPVFILLHSFIIH